MITGYKCYKLSRIRTSLLLSVFTLGEDNDFVSFYDAPASFENVPPFNQQYS